MSIIKKRQPNPPPESFLDVGGETGPGVGVGPGGGVGPGDGVGPGGGVGFGEVKAHHGHALSLE